MPAPGDMSAALAAQFKAACLAELEALKPGNVHIFADGHGMVVQDFVRSAEAAAGVIARPEATVGERIDAAVEATWAAVGCNTNLGIVLLCAPLIQAAPASAATGLQAALQAVLRALTVEDAVCAYRAIRRAAPAGLGASAQHDVHDVPAVTLLEAMRAAQDRDRIAWQYVQDYADIFDRGLPRYRELLQRWERPAWAATGVYLTFLSRFPDTHVARKFGTEAAAALQQEAAGHVQAFCALENPRHYLPALLQFDADLKARGLNPGTCADLTVATLLAHGIENLMTGFAGS